MRYRKGTVSNITAPRPKRREEVAAALVELLCLALKSSSTRSGRREIVRSDNISVLLLG